MAVSPDKVEVFAKALEETGVIGQAMRKAGYSDSAADRGKAHLPPPMRTAVELWEQAQEKIKLGQQLTKESANNLIKGSLARVVIEGKDADVVSAAGKLGQHRDVDAFQSEQTVGVLMVMPPEVLSVIAERLQVRAPVALPATVIEAESVVPPSDVTKE
jgi:hypothetical protein